MAEVNDDQIIETVTEDGEVVQFKLFDIVEFEEKEYALLLPLEDEDNEVAEDSTFGESIETEEVSEEKGKKLMNKASNKVGGSVTGTPGKSLF